MNLTHGGDVAGFQAEYGFAPLDFSANVSPLGLPPGVLKAASDALTRSDRYPDPLCRALTAAIAAHEGCPPEDILCGAGAADLIFRAVLAKKPRAALVTAPAFAEYEAALAVTGCPVKRHLLRREEGFALTPRFLGDLTADIDLVFLCQPNNPTGRTVDPALALQVLARCREIGALLIMDECFADLLDRPEDFTMKAALGQGNLLILKAFTKSYAMAGLRLGYCLCGDRALLAAMARCGQPWAVSAPAQAAGVAALADKDYLARLRALVAEEKPKLIRGLKALGCTVYGSEANFVFFSAAPGLDAALRRRGVLIRPCGNYPGLELTDYRAAVRTGPENQALLAAIDHCRKELTSWPSP